MASGLAGARIIPTKRAKSRTVATFRKVNAKSNDKLAGVGSAAVEKATGKSWEQWLRVLDRAGAKKLEHKQIAKLLQTKHELSGWWAQMVTVGYEQAQLGRQKHEKPGGFEIGASKTINVTITKLYRAWSDKRTRKRWLPEYEFETRKATSGKSMRITWVDGVTHVDAYFYEKGPGKSQVALQHKKLKNAKSGEKIKRMWATRLADLKKMLEK